jgi:hypothetical protein
MRRQRMHLVPVSRTPSVGQTNYMIKLQATTDIIDRLLLIDRQTPWKATGPSGTGDTGDNTDGTGGGGGTTLPGL